MPVKFTPARRDHSKILLALYSRSGAGKTYSALLLARGLVGPTGSIALADTETGRGALYADVAEIGGYGYAEIEPPFTPMAYMQAIDEAEKQGVDALVIDSMSHEWEGTGGVLEWAAKNEAEGKKGLLVWKDPKTAHLKLILRLLRARCHVIVCLRAKRKSRMTKKQGGGTEVVKDDFYTPKQDEDFIFEMMGHAELLLPTPTEPNVTKHSIRVTKPMHPALAPVFFDGLVISKETGRQMAEWCNGGKPQGATTETKAGKPADSKPAGNAPAKDLHGDVPWKPAAGWPKFPKLRPWTDWSCDTFLPTADRVAALAWREYWSDYFDALQQAAVKDAAAKAAFADIDRLLKEAIKREAAT